MGIISPNGLPPDLEQAMQRRFAPAPVPQGTIPPPPPSVADRLAYLKANGGTVSNNASAEERLAHIKQVGGTVQEDPFPYTDAWFNQVIPAHKQAAQEEMNKAFGPESETSNPPGLLERVGHQLKSLGHEATATVAGMEQGIKDPTNLAVLAAGAIDPAIPASYFGTQAVSGLTGVGQPPPPPGQSSSSVVNAIRNPSPENVQNALLQGSTLAGSVAGGLSSPKAGTAYTTIKRTPKIIAKEIASNAGVTGDLAGKVEQKVAQASAMKREAATDIQKLHSDTQLGVQQLQGELDAATKGTTAVLKQLEQETASIPGAKLNATQAIVRNTAQAVAQKAAQVQAPFEEMAAKATTPVAQAPDIYSIIRDSVNSRGANPQEIPPAAFKALPKETPESALTGLEGLPPDEVAKFKTNNPDLFQSDVSFRTLNRVKEDLYQAARASKDAQVRAGLDLARQRIIDMQEKYAQVNGFGDQYLKAKRDYFQFKRELGSGLMDDFLNAQTIEDQEMAGKLAQVTRGTNAQALRTLLKTAGVDTSPLDDLIQRQSGIKAETIAAKKSWKAQTSDIQSRIGDIQKESARAIGAREGEAEKSIASLGKEKPVIAGMSDFDLVGKSNEEIARLKLKEQFDKAHESGIVNFGRIALIIYGVEKMLTSGSIAGTLEGAAMTGYGAGRMLTPSVVRSPAFQDWVIRNSGITDPVMVRRVKAGLQKAMPMLIQGAATSKQNEPPPAP